MRVKVNGEERQIQAGMTVRALIELLRLTEGPVAVEQNGEVIPRAEHAKTPLNDGDEIEIVHFVGGG